MKNTVQKLAEAAVHQAECFQSAAAMRSAAYRKIANTHPRGTTRDAYLMLAEAALHEVNGIQYTLTALKDQAEAAAVRSIAP